MLIVHIITRQAHMSLSIDWGIMLSVDGFTLWQSIQTDHSLSTPLCESMHSSLFIQFIAGITELGI